MKLRRIRAVMVTAQETYREMMKTQVAPALRGLGFKGSCQNYELPSPGHWAMLGFQKSAWSDASALRFTVNVLVVSRLAWESARSERSYVPTRPTANRLWGDFAWQKRIGALLPGGQDRWWEVEADDTTDDLAAEVVSAVEDFALPAMREQIGD
jgi:uncharacterized protein DUF4304